MRTTINLPDGLVAEVKAQAASSGRTFTSFVEEGLRVLLAERRDAERRDAEPAPGEPLPSYGDPAAAPLIDLADRDAMWAALDLDARR